MQADPAELGRWWLAAARQDLDVARDVAPRFPNVACFHAQQTAEKALKALLVRASGDVPRSHLADHLLAEARHLGLELRTDVETAAVALDKFYAPTRYPDALGSSLEGAYQADEASLAIRWAETVYAEALRRLAEDQ